MAAKRMMSEDHKRALAEGRESARAVKDYLDSLDASPRRPGRRRTPESIAARLDAIATEISTASPLRRLQLVQERIDLETELTTEEVVDVSSLEARFVEFAGDYAARKGISYAAWREIGVQPAVLRAAGISRK